MTETRTNYCVACKEMADRIEELEAWKAAEEAHHHMLRAEAAENARIIGMSAEREMALRGEVERLRGLLREAEVKLTDVQGAYATKRYADNLLARIRAALEGKSNE